MARRGRASTNRRVAQIVVSYCDTVLEVTQLDARKPEYRVGEDSAADFVLGPLERSTVLVRERDERIEITIPPGFVCAEQPNARAGDVLVFDADECQRVSLCAGALRIHISRVSAEPLLDTRPRLDRPFLASLLANFVCAAVFLGLLRATPEDPVAREEQLERAAFRLADYNDAGSGGHTRLPGPGSQNDDLREEMIAGIASARGKHEVGKRGYARPGPKHNTEHPGAGPRGGEGLDRNSSPAAAAREVGILGMITAGEGFEAFVDTGGVWDGPADGAMWASTGGLAGDGVGGLSLAGTGRGGGGLATGVAGLAHAGVLTPTGGSGSLVTSGKAAFGGRSRRTPRTYICLLMVQGASDRDIIRRVIRAHENEVRACYNQALVDQPTLAGRVTVDFTLASSGTVTSAVISADETRDEQLRTCITRAVKRWKFPAVRGGGTSLVSYTYDLRVD